MLKIRRPLGCLIFNMGIAIPGKTVFLIEMAPWCFPSLRASNAELWCFLDWAVKVPLIWDAMTPMMSSNVMKTWWRHQMEAFSTLPCWPFVWGIHRSPVNSPHKGQWRWALMFSLMHPSEKCLSKQLWGSWFETPLHPLWHRCIMILSKDTPYLASHS